MKAEGKAMDQHPKRKLLSLSLSQSSKQHKKLRLKRNPSNGSENEKNSPELDVSKEFCKRRDTATCISPTQTSLSLPEKCEPLNKSIPEFKDSSSTSLQYSAVKYSTDGCSPMKECGLQDTSNRNFSEGLCGKELSASNACSNSRNRTNSKELSMLKAPNQMDLTREVSEVVSDKDGNIRNDRKSPFCPSKSRVVTATNGNADKAEINSAHSSSKGSLEYISKFSAVSYPTNKDVTSCDIRTPNLLQTDATVNESPVEVLQCPLCYKMFDKIPAKTAHVKGCALKYKMSTHQLLDALALQQKQAAERRALGLPAIPSSVGSSKKATGPKQERGSSRIDNNLQLAMALSLSLQDHENKLDFNYKPEEPKEISLDHFGFTSKTILGGIHPRPSTSAGRGKLRPSDRKVPTLLTRTSDERQRIITEKVAMVLLEEKQRKTDESGIFQIDLKSPFLQELVNKENMLWEKSHTSPSKCDKASYYVNGLRGFISPSKVKTGSKVMHVSQVVGRVKTPTKELKDFEPAEEAINSSSLDEDVLSNSSSPVANNSKTTSQVEMELRAKLFNDWAGMVNNASMSDLSIYPKEGREIPTHKIVLYVRCPRILKDISRQRNTLTGNEVEVIMWSKTPHAAALAFLEYIYCGSVKSIRVLSEDLSSIVWLANHYKSSDLKLYLEALKGSSQPLETPSQAALNVLKDNCESPLLSQKIFEENEVIIAEVTESPSSEDVIDHLITFPINQPSDNSGISSSSPTRCETESIYSEVTLAEPENRFNCSSPDLFGDEEFMQTPDDALEAEKNTVNNSEAGDTERWSTSSKKNLPRDEANRDCLSHEPSFVSSDKINAQKPKTFHPHSHGESVCSDETDLMDYDSEPPSPDLSQGSVATKVLDFNQSAPKLGDLSLNDSKRKLSGSSKGSDDENSKRPCPNSPNVEAERSPKHSDVEIFDLTQDSDSNTSFPLINKNFSGDSYEKTSLSSQHDAATVQVSRRSNSCETFDKQTELHKLNVASSKCDEIESKESNLNCKSMGETAEAYVSPVWDGFEDVNYDDNFLYTDAPINEVYIECEKNNSMSKLLPSSSTEDKSCSSSGKVSKSPSKRDILQKTPELEGRNENNNSSSDCEVTYHSPAVTKKPDSHFSGYEALLDDSLNVSDTILQQAEKGLHEKFTQRETKGTPVNRILSGEGDSVTPLANYSAMKTPQLKRELQKFGLKPTLGKRKGKIMLRHIYNELHPWVPMECSNPTVSESLSLSQPNCSNKTETQALSSSQPNSRKRIFSNSNQLNCNSDHDVDSYHEKTESDSDSSDSGGLVNTSLHEIRILEGDCDVLEALPHSASQPVFSKANLPKVVLEFITHDRELHQKVLEYEPISIEKLQLDLRAAVLSSRCRT